MGIDLGRDLGTPRLSWRRLWLILERLPETSALFRERNPDTFRWNLPEQLLAVVCDLLAVGNWMQSEDGRKNRNRPKPIERPGVRDGDDKKKIGGGAASAMNLAEADAWLSGAGVSFKETGNDLVM